MVFGDQCSPKRLSISSRLTLSIRMPRSSHRAPWIFIPSLRATQRAADCTILTVTISIRAAFLLVAALFAAGCAPADAPSTAAPTSAAACAPGALPTLTPGTLTIGTDQPVYQP